MAGTVGFWYSTHWQEIADSIRPDLQMDDNTGRVEGTGRGLLGDRAISELETRDRYLEDYLNNLKLTQVQRAGASARRALSNQAIPDGPSGAGWVRISFDTVDYDTGPFFNLLADPTVLTISAAGLYLVSFTSNFARNSTGNVRGLRIYNSDGGTSYATSQSVPINATYWWEGTVAKVVVAAAGSHIVAQMYQDSGGNLNAESGTGAIGVADQQPTLTIVALSN